MLGRYKSVWFSVLKTTAVRGSIKIVGLDALDYANVNFNG